MRIGLVGCTKSKLGRQAAARDLYSPSARFRGRRRYVERTCEDWFILSAKHHVLAPDELVDPYDVTLVGAPTHVKRSWARAVLIELEDRRGHVSEHHFEIHAGRDYWAFGLLEGLEERGAKISIPAKGLGMFKLLTFYAKQGPGQTPGTGDPGRKKSGSYEPLLLRYQSRPLPPLPDLVVEVLVLEEAMGRKSATFGRVIRSPIRTCGSKPAIGARAAETTCGVES